MDLDLTCGHRLATAPYLGILLLFFSIPFASGQMAEVKIDYTYEGEDLRYVIDDLYERYDLRFAYSSRFIPLDSEVYSEGQQVELAAALEELFDPVAVSYRFVGRQIVLRPKEVKVEEITKAPPEPEVSPQTPVYRDERMEELMAARREKWKARLPYLQKRYISSIQGNKPLDQIDLSEYQMQPNDRYFDPRSNFFSNFDSLQIALANIKDERSRITQFSLFPFLGTNTLSSYQVTNQFSVNLLWGMNGGVKGKEFGGIANTIREDVQGVQIAGLVNTVGDDMIGTQISGLANFAADTVQGVQIAGLFNVSGYGTAVQIAGLANIARGGFEGIQSSFLYNSINGDGNAVQLSGLINRAKGDTKLQLATLINKAEDVRSGQASFLYNKAKKVDGFQLGLINVADSVGGIPIGLINIVKKGYNRTELSTSEYLTGNFALKIGVKRFYNIFIIGARVDDFQTIQGLDIKEMSWGLGYGIGSTVTLSRRILLNFELQSLHINEQDSWTEELHQLNQFELLLDWRWGRRSSIYAGPSFNWMVSRLEDPETGEIGTRFAPDPIFDRTRNGINSKMWLGFNAGLRF